MISKNVPKFCKDDVSLIENYIEAVNSTEMWDCHHRLETELNLSAQVLIDKNLYYNRPASELIFLTHSEHVRLHFKGKLIGEKNPMYGKNAEDLMTPEAILCKRKKQSESHKGEKNHMYGKPAPNKNKHRVYHSDGSYHYEK